MCIITGHDYSDGFIKQKPLSGRAAPGHRQKLWLSILGLGNGVNDASKRNKENAMEVSSQLNLEEKFAL